MLSVIIPIYNAAALLPSCLESLLAYTGSDLELLLIDDGSADESGAIADHYADTDVRVKVWHQANAGVSAARNLGLEHATGEWISFVDADDEVMPGYVEACLQRTKAADIAYFTHEGYTLKAQSCCDRPSIEAAMLALKCDAQGFEFFGYTWNKFFRASIIREHGLRFDTTLSHREDEVFTMEYCRYAESLEVLDQVLYRYRIDDSAGHLTARKLDAGTLLNLSMQVERQAAFCETKALRGYEYFRAIYMGYDAMRRASVLSQWPIANRLCHLLQSQQPILPVEQLPAGLLEHASSSFSMVVWLTIKKLKDKLNR